MGLQLAEQVVIYYASVVLRETLDCFMLIHEIMVDPGLKHPLEVIFLSKTRHAQSESV